MYPFNAYQQVPMYPYPPQWSYQYGPFYVQPPYGEQNYFGAPSLEQNYLNATSHVQNYFGAPSFEQNYNGAASLEQNNYSAPSPRVFQNSNIPVEDRERRRKFTQYEIDYAWSKGQIIPGKDPNLYRMDKCGNVIYYHSYGMNTPMGWDVDHSKPLAKGGTYHLNNLQPLQAEQNRVSKSDNYPYNYDAVPQRGVTRYDLIKTDVDKRSSAARSQDILFNYDGSIDKRSKAVRDGSVLLTQDGKIDKRCSAYRSGKVLLK